MPFAVMWIDFEGLSEISDTENYSITHFYVEPKIQTLNTENRLLTASSSSKLGGWAHKLRKKKGTTFHYKINHGEDRHNMVTS